MSSILVGLDLSPSSRAALQWAAEQARLTGRRLLAINAVPIPTSLTSVGIIGTPESAIEEGNIDVAHREAVSAVWDQCGRGWDGLWSLFWTMPDARWSHGRRKQRCWLLALTSMLGLPGWSRVRSAATA